MRSKVDLVECWGCHCDIQEAFASVGAPFALSALAGPQMEPRNWCVDSAVEVPQCILCDSPENFRASVFLQTGLRVFAEAHECPPPLSHFYHYLPRRHEMPLLPDLRFILEELAVRNLLRMSCHLGNSADLALQELFAHGLDSLAAHSVLRLP